MKLKYYMRGLGIGVIGTTIVMTITNNVRGVANTTQQNQTTTSSVLAYTTAASTESTSQDATEVGATTQESVATLSSEETSAETKKTSTETTQAAEATTQERTQPQTSTSKNTGKSVDVVIKDVYYSSQAADILYKAGVITDKDGFVSYMKSSGYTTRIKEGVYSIEPGESFENIAKIITKSK